MLGLVLALALSQTGVTSPEGPIFSNPAALNNALLYVATSGRSQPTSIDSAFCTTYASELTGASSVCMDGSGTQTGTLALTETGTVTDSNTYICPNGTTCALTAGQRISTGNYWASANTDSPSGDFSICVLTRLDTSGTMVSKDDGSNYRIGFNITATSRGYFYISSTTGLTDTTSTSVAYADPGIPTFQCVTYDYVGDGTSVATLYSNGSVNGSSSAQKGPARATSSTPWRIGMSATTVTPQTHYVTFITEKVLSAGTITNMAAALLPDLKDSRANSVSTTRASVRSCFGGTSTNAYGSILQSNRECVDSDNRLHVWGSHSNLVTRSTELEQWTAAGSPTESANSGTAPDGTRTADLIGDDDGAGLEGETNTATVSAGAAYTLSCYAAAGTSSTGHLTLDGTACPFTLTGSNFNRVSCTDASSSGVSIATGAYPTSSTVGDTGTMWFWGCQVNSGSIAAPFVPTYATVPVTASADNITIPVPTGFGNEGCARICVTPSWTGNPSAAQYFLNGDTGGNVRLFYANGSATDIASWNGTTSAAIAHNFTAGSERCYRLTWSAVANSMQMHDLTAGTSGTAVAFSGWSGTDATFQLGSYNGASFFADSRLGGIVIDDSPNGCRQ